MVGCLGLLLGAAAYGQIHLQVIDPRTTLVAAGKAKRLDRQRLDNPRRGTIFTQDGLPVAEDTPKYRLTIDYKKVPVSDAFALAVAEVTGIPAEQIRAGGLSFLRSRERNLATLVASPRAKQEKPRSSRSWSVDLDADSLQAINEVKESWGADGLSADIEAARTYPMGEAMAGIVGRLRKVGLPPRRFAVLTGMVPKAFVLDPAEPKGMPRERTERTALEKRLQPEIQGARGVRLGMVDGSGQFLQTRMVDTGMDRVDGKNVKLTIVAPIQTLSYEALKAEVVARKAKQGAVIVIEPQTGNLLAMANYPSFDPAPDAENPKGTSDFNTATMAQLPPGSLFKVLTLPKALEICPEIVERKIECKGYREVGGRRVTCPKHHGVSAHGWVDMTQAIAKSCNVVAATWALGIGHDNYIQYLKDLGLLSPPEVDLPGVKPGYYSPDPNEQLQLATWGFGQSFNASPLALASALAMIGNDGKRMKPRLIDEIGGVPQPTTILKQVIRPETARRVMTCMQAVFDTDHGTGRTLRIPGYALAGKTGTAQKLGKNLKGYVSNFVGFVPAPSPRALILVMIDEPQGKQHMGAEVAGPVFKKVAEGLIQYYRIPPSRPAIRLAASADVRVAVREARP